MTIERKQNMQIELFKQHEHQRQMLRPGDTINVSRKIGQWLISKGIGAPLKTNTPKKEEEK
jgi:hypothetical protein